MLFFGVGSGRCGTMAISNYLNTETGVTCLHEGKIRDMEEAGDQWLPFLTLQNFAAYKNPAQALPILQKTRSMMPDLLKKHRLTALGDIAYNYAPFVGVIPQLFPKAKLLVMFRNGKNFVRSAYTKEAPDPTPVGWLDDRELSAMERYIALGRLRPTEDNDSIDPETWQEMTPLEKNAWLWSETNRLILQGLEQWNPKNVLRIKFEEFFSNPVSGYEQIRAFLQLPGKIPQKAQRLLNERPINSGTNLVLPPPQQWRPEWNKAFQTYAGEMMMELGYS